MRRERVRNFSGTCPWVPPGAGRLLSPPSGVRRGRSPRSGGRRVWAGAALVLLLAAPVVAQTTVPPVITSATTFTLDENTTAVATLTATDADADPLEWSIPTDGGADAEQFTLTSAGDLTFSTAPDYEAPADADEDHVYEVTIQVSDGTTPVTADLEVTVENVTELTAISGPAAVSFAENSWGRVATFTASSAQDRDGIEWILSGPPDSAHFSLDNPAGALRFDLDPVAPNRFAPPPDFEAPADADEDNEYAVTLRARAGSALSATAFAVAVTDVDEAGAVSLSAPRPALGDELTAALSDPDGVTGSAAWQWERSAGRNAWAEIEEATAAAYTPVAADTGEFLRVTATYADAHGADKTVSEVAADVVRGPLLTGLTAETVDSQADTTQVLYPAFRAKTLHYGIGCDATDTLTVNVAGPAGARVSVDGVQAVSGTAVAVAVTESSDVPISVVNANGARTVYTIHCMVDTLFQVETYTYPYTDPFEDLILFSKGAHLVAMDHNGVPRFRRSVPNLSGFASRFYRVGADGAYRYAFASRSAGLPRYTILDENLEVLAEGVTIVSPLERSGQHDFQLLENGNYLLLAYEPATRDLSDLDLPYEDGVDVSAVSVRDAVVQIVTPGGEAVFNWNSWDHMALEDCVQHHFPVRLSTETDPRDLSGEYAHINGMHLVNGLLVASMRGCSKVLGIDVTSGDTRGDVVWRMGRTNLSDAAWAARDIGPRPLDFINDPEGEFCGQHVVRFLPNGNVFLFDNGVACLINPWTFRVLGRSGFDFSRAVEYALDLENHEAVFVRDHSLRGARAYLGHSNGAVDALDNGDWLVSWGRALVTRPFPNNEMATVVDPATGQNKLGLRFRELPSDTRQRRINATVVPAEALAPQPVPLTAEIIAGSAVYHSGINDTPGVVVAFSHPVVADDFAPTSPSLSVTGATVASVSAHVVAGAPAHAYLVTLTPTDDGPITFSLDADQACADGGICTADGTLLSEVPTAAHAIPGPVTVSFEEASYDANEGGTTSVVVELNRVHDRPDPVEMPLVVQTGGTATEHTDYTVPAAVTFATAETTKSVVLQAVADSLLEGAETVAVAFGALPTGVTAGTPTTTTVTIADQTPAAQFTLTLNRRDIPEGGDVAVTVDIDNGVTFATDQTFTLTFRGSATQGSDYTVDSLTLFLLAGQDSVETTLHVTDDPDTENAETIEIAVAHGGTPPIPTQTATIPASDQPAITPHISVYAGPSPAGEAEGASFTVTRTGATTARLTVAVRVTESGSLLAGPPPTTVTFAVGQENVPQRVSTEDDTIVEGVSATSVVTVAMQADTTNDPPLYLLGSPASAQVTVEDDDVAEFEVTVSPNPVPEGTPATVTVAITTGVTFPADQTLTILVVSDTATQGTDYTVGATTLTLVAGETSVPTVVTVLDDKAEEPAETLGITAEHGGQEVGQAMLTIAASADTAPPTLEQAEVPRAGRSLRLTFSEPLDEANAPPRTAFVVTVDDNGTVTSMAVTTVVVSGETVTLSLAAPVLPGQVVTVDYTVPSSAWPALQDPTGNEVVSFADEAVDNQAVRRPVVTRPPSGGGGGGGSACTDDLHGNSAAQASAIALATVTPGAICPVADVDYFTVTAPGRGLLFVDTAGSVSTRGTLWQDGVVLASGPTDASGQAARLGARVQAGPVVVAVQGQGGATGSYDLVITFTPGSLENPGPDSFQSGVGVLSGWVCGAAVVEIELNGVPQEAAYGTERVDTADVCGDTDNGFGLLFNWNLLGDGTHTVVALVDGVELDRATVTVTTLGAEFVRDSGGTCEAADFPVLGERVTLVWQQNSQNFVLARGSPPTRTGPGQPTLLTGFLENPGHNSFQSGIGVLSGWVCDADRVELVLGDLPVQIAAYGTERLDTAGVCGDTDNGFGLLFNWNLLGEGEHDVVAFVDGVELGRATVQVTTLGHEFLRGAEGECVVEDFPTVGETVTLAWQQNQQNFVMTAVQ